jgi:hypothetical protein
MFSFLSLAVIAAILPTLFAVDNAAQFVRKSLDKIQANFLSKIAKPLNTTAEGAYVLSHYYEKNDCSGGEVHYTAYPTGLCFNDLTNGGSSRWSCNGDSAKYEAWTVSDCCGNPTGGTSIQPTQCFPLESDTPSFQGSSFSCSASYVPAGKWWSYVEYTDGNCQYVFQASHMKDDYCVNYGGFSVKIDYPYECIDMAASNCTTCSPQDVSSIIDLCTTATTNGGAVNSYQNMYFNT